MFVPIADQVELVVDFSESKTYNLLFLIFEKNENEYDMSGRELKDILHRQIEMLEDPEDVRDLFLTVNDFLGHRHLWDEESPEFLEQLRRALESVHAGSATLPNSQIMREAKEWITK